MSTPEQAYQRGHDAGAREEAMQWREGSRPDVIAEALHEGMEHQFDECNHGTYSGGGMNGQPYKMCEILAGYVYRKITGIQEGNPSRHSRERYEQDRANREVWNANPTTKIKLRIQTYEEWRDEHEWADALRTNPFLTFDEWKAMQS